MIYKKKIIKVHYNYNWHTQLQSAVQESPEHLYLRLQPFLQAHFVSSWQLVATGGSVVQHICHVFPFYVQPHSAGLTFWIGYCCLAPDYPSLVDSTFCMLFKDHTGWWDRIIGLLLSDKEIQPCLIDTRNGSRSIRHEDNKVLQLL